jgi:hypothetical protein
MYSSIFFYLSYILLPFLYSFLGLLVFFFPQVELKIFAVILFRFL